MKSSLFSSVLISVSLLCASASFAKPPGAAVLAPIGTEKLGNDTSRPTQRGVEPHLPFSYCGQPATVVVNGKKLPASLVKKFEKCDDVANKKEFSVVVNGYKNRKGSFNMNFKNDITVLRITITDEKGNVVTDWQ